MARRSRAREVALQVLYQDDLNPQHHPADDEQFVAARLQGAELVDFANSLIAGVRRNRGELDAMLAQTADHWSLERMARAGGMSRTLLAERFRERLGVPPMRYLATWRLQKARALLAAGALPVGDLARRVGYASESAFSRAFREQFGAPPGAFRRQRDASRSGPA